MVHLRRGQQNERTPLEVRRRLKKRPRHLEQFQDLEKGLKKGVIPARIEGYLERLLPLAFGVDFPHRPEQKAGSEPPPKMADMLLAFARISSADNLSAVLKGATSEELETARGEVKQFFAEAESLRLFFENAGYPGLGRKMAERIHRASVDDQRAVLELWLAFGRISIVRQIHTWLLAHLLHPLPTAGRRTE
jgi:hypothetical protein